MLDPEFEERVIGKQLFINVSKVGGFMVLSGRLHVIPKSVSL